MNLQVYQVDTFTNKVFSGNSAAVCPLEEWLSDELMQNIAMENALAETAFFVCTNKQVEIRWFTPEIEMDLCGHATLAAAPVLTRHLSYNKSSIKFAAKSGELLVHIDKPLIHLDLPSRKPMVSQAPAEILESLSIQPIAVFQSRDYLLLFESEAQIRELKVNQSLLDRINLDPGGVVVTARGESVDFVSRYFTPQASILEDPVTGSAHCSLIPYWAEKLSKNTMTAAQLSQREGQLYCQNLGDRVQVSGEAVTYMIGTICI